jgi:hypothetical protein
MDTNEVVPTANVPASVISKKHKFYVLFVLVAALAALALLAFQHKNNKTLLTDLNECQKNSNECSGHETPEKKYIDLGSAAGFTVFTSVNDKNEVDLKVYILAKDEIEMPFLLSDYDHILLINHSFRTQNFSLVGDIFSERSYGSGEPFDSGNLKGTKHTDSGGKVRASLETFDDDGTLLGTGMQIVAKDEETFLGLIELAKNYSTSGSPKYGGHGGTVLPKIVHKTPNYKDPRLPYEYYVPNGYVSSESPFQGYPNVYFSNQQEELLCLSFKEDKNDPCSFSTSGCTCCNTGCKLIDFVSFASRDGRVYIEPILQKGQGEEQGESAGARFIYNVPHPWLYYTAYYSSPKNTSEGVIDLIHLLDSMERSY